jgi:hypothetical protein
MVVLLCVLSLANMQQPTDTMHANKHPDLRPYLNVVP